MHLKESWGAFLLKNAWQSSILRCVCERERQKTSNFFNDSTETFY